MKATDEFKNVIIAHLEGVAAKDHLFAESFKKEGKNIDDCITYILNTVKNSGCSGFADAEIFGMAVHYYDEDKITVGAPVSGKVVVNHSVANTPVGKAINAPEKKKPPVKKVAIENQPLLF